MAPKQFRTAAQMSVPVLAILMKGYPRLSETFIAQELLALQERGFAFDIWSLRKPYDGGRTHPVHDRIAANSIRSPFYLPEYLHRAPIRVLRGLVAARRMAGFRAALRLWKADLRRNRTRNRIRRFGQACVLAAELPPEVRFLYAHFLHTPASVARYAAVMRGIGWGFSAHARDIWTIPDWEKAEKIADCTFGVTCTQSGADSLRRWGGAKITLAYHGLDLATFPDPPERLWEQLGGKAQGERSFHLLSVGRLVVKKGYDTLFDALRLLPSGLDWTFTHIGGGELERHLQARAQASGFASRIQWLGKRDRTDVIRALREADLFVLPSIIAADGDRDGLPNVLMEAASQKLPIISTRDSAASEFIRDGVDGVLVSSGAPQELASAINILAADPTGRKHMAESAYARLTDKFTIDTGIDLIARQLEAALGAKQ